MIVTLDFSIVANWQQVSAKFKDINSKEYSVWGNLLMLDEVKSARRTIFSDVEINFNNNRIASVTAKDVDQDIKDSVRSNSQLASEIAQLLVDVQSLDDSEVANWSLNNLDKPLKDASLSLRMDRFKNAFDFIFPSLKYKKTRNEKNAKKIVFENFGKEIDLEHLSSGEKQIVFRGSFLLKDQKSNHGIIVLIDEPEISLHPNWQLKICGFFKRLFVNENELQTSQIFMVTHSPFILHSTDRRSDGLIIFERTEDGTISIQKEPKFFNWTPEEVIKNAFDIDLKISPDKPTVFLEGETDEIYFNDANSVLNEGLDVVFKWVGYKNEDNMAIYTGDTALNKVYDLYEANPDELNKKIVLMYDHDVAKIPKEIKKIAVRKSMYNSNNKIFRAGIENLLTIDQSINVDEFFSVTIKPNRYSGETTVKTLDKMKLCKWVVKQTPEMKKILYKEFSMVFQTIRDALKEV